jgi:hypothetical protein
VQCSKRPRRGLALGWALAWALAFLLSRGAVRSRMGVRSARPIRLAGEAATLRRLLRWGRSGFNRLSRPLTTTRRRVAERVPCCGNRLLSRASWSAVARSCFPPLARAVRFGVAVATAR